MLTTAQARPTHSHSHPTMRPSSICDHPKDIGPTQASHIFPASPHTLTDVIEAERPHTLQQRAGVVYRIPCSSCSRVYIGQTGRTMEHCLKEHKRALTSGNTAQSGVAEHAVEQTHEINWKEAEVVDSHSYYRQRCVLEAWHIRTEHQTMNRDEDPLSSEYNPLIRQLRPAEV